MYAQWFSNNFPPSRSVIENDLRLAFWQAGFKGAWFSCTKDTAPFVCEGGWNASAFSIEWAPLNYLLLTMKAANQDVLEMFERVLKHKALAAYKNADGSVVVEWRVKQPDARVQELQASGVAQLERLDK